MSITCFFAISFYLNFLNYISNTHELRKIKGHIYEGNLGFYKNTKDILGVLLKNSLNLIPLLPIPPNFGGMKTWDFERKWRIGYSLLSITSPST